MTAEHQWHLLDAMPDAVVAVRSDASIAWVNANAEPLFGYSRDEFSHLALDRLIPDRFRESHAEHFSAFFANPLYRPMGTGFEVKALRRNGSEFNVDISLGTAPTLVVNEVFSKLRAVPPSAAASNRMGDVEQAHILGVLEDCNWRIKGPQGAAKRLGMNPSTLRYRLKKLGIRRPGTTG